MTSPAEITLGKFDSRVGHTDEINIIYHLTNLSAIALKYDIGVTPNPLPENDAQGAIIIKVTGNLLTCEVSWVMKQSDDNRVTGTGFTSSSKSVGEQLNFFDKVFQSTGIADKYRFNIAYADKPYTQDGLVTDMTFDTQGDTPLAWLSKITMVIGNVVSVYELDVPSEPNSFSVITNGSANNKISWTVPDDAGGSAILKYVIQRRDELSNYVDLFTTANPSTFTYNDTSAVTGVKYFYRVAAINTAGRGTYTDPLSVVTV